jgi:hypothetical protein
MSKKPPKQVEIPKVVPLTEEKRHVIASDQKSQRIIVGIGQQRIAFDLFTRITRLPPHTWGLARARGHDEEETEMSNKNHRAATGHHEAKEIGECVSSITMSIELPPHTGDQPVAIPARAR